MIRPVTCVCALLAGGAGLFLYQAKHRTLMIDREIEQTYHQIEDTRSKIGILQAEWALLNSPDRLAELGDKFLSLKPVAPTQFVTLADLDSRLPPPGAAVAEAGSIDEPAEAAADKQTSAETSSARSASIPPAPAAPPAALRREARHERTAAEPRREAAADPRSARRAQEPRRSEPTEHRRSVAVAERDTAAARHARSATSHAAASYAALTETARPHPARAQAEPRLVRPTPVYAAEPAPARPVAYTRTPPVTGSLLGGVHAVMAPPVPVADVR
jgi:hypothetical protein